MPPGFRGGDSPLTLAFALAPAGQPTIAQRFNAGSDMAGRQVPKGRLIWLAFFSRRFGTVAEERKANCRGFGLGGLRDLGSRATDHRPRITHHVSRHPFCAFTLVELLLVMTIMIATISIAAPTLANFFRGRSLDSEARQLLSLTHAGQSRAVFEGVPMLLWVDPANRTYGLREEPGWVDTDPKAVDFTLDKDLHFEMPKTSAPQSISSLNPAVSEARRRANPSNLPEIRFLPDGSIDETSPTVLRLYDRENTSRYLILATNRVSYEIQSEYNQ